MPRKLIAIMLLGGSTQAVAQQTANNVVTQSDDAFGRTTGSERIGIYSADEVRGFNPSEAGNARVEGLYAELGALTSPRLIASSAIRVGYASRGTPFVAPTGIVDFRIEKFAGKKEISAELEAEDYANVGGAIEAKLPIVGDSFGAALGFGFREADQVQGRNGSFRSYMAGLGWLPQKDSEVLLFSGGYMGRHAETAQFSYPAGSYVPPEQPRKLKVTQPWAENRNSGNVSGLIAKFPIAGLKFEGGLFHSTRLEPITFVTLQLATEPSGRIGNLLVIADQNNKTLSTSGEVRLSKIWSGTRLRHTLYVNVRGRQQDRTYGGQQRISLGASQTGVTDFRPQPIFNFGIDDHSTVRQFFFGLQYNLQTTGGSSISLAAQKASYRKLVDFASPAQTDTVSRSSPWLFSASGTVALSSKLSAYGGYIRGMEDSATAPDIAINRSEAPPALQTQQADLGLRYAITPRFSVIAGIFQVKKPYFGIDAAQRFGNLGKVSNRGLELSLTGKLAAGLSLVAGGIWVDPTVSGTEVDAGRLGKQPVGTFKRRGILNLDWQPAGQEAWSFDLALEGKSGEMADRLNSFSSPDRFTANLGLRYRFTVAGSKILLRGQVQNVTNEYGWRVNSGGGFSFTPTRTFSLHLIADL